MWGQEHFDVFLVCKTVVIIFGRSNWILKAFPVEMRAFAIAAWSARGFRFLVINIGFNVFQSIVAHLPALFARFVSLVTPAILEAAFFIFAGTFESGVVFHIAVATVLRASSLVIVEVVSISINLAVSIGIFAIIVFADASAINVKISRHFGP